MAPTLTGACDADVTDGESELRQLEALISNASTTAMDVCDSEDRQLDVRTPAQEVERLVSFYANQLVSIFLHGVAGWTVDSRTRHLRGLHALCSILGPRVSPHLPDLLQTLAGPVRDDEQVIRVETESCCIMLGSMNGVDSLLDLLVPRLLGEVSGCDTAPARTSALLLATHILSGMATNPNLSPQSSTRVAREFSAVLASPALYAYGDVLVHEAALLFVRNMLRLLPLPCRSEEVQRNLLLSLLYLQSRGRCSKRDSVVTDAARGELVRLAKLHALPPGQSTLEDIEVTKSTSSATSKSRQLAAAALAALGSSNKNNNSSSSSAKKVEPAVEEDIIKTHATEVDCLLTAHFVPIFEILSGRLSSEASGNPDFSTFDSLLRLSARQSWMHWERVLAVITPRVQPSSSLTAQSSSDSAAADTVEPLLNLRLMLLALVESLVRAAAADWQCASQLRQASESVLRHIVVPNLVWRAGRVEATLRKVAMAICYAVLKAGAVEAQTLFKSATELVPLIVSHLEDSDTTCRLIACPALQILFERLRGAFSEQAVHEMYPKLLKRLDDSSDEVRLAALETLRAFFQCGPPTYFAGTLIDYSLDQLFIHLDDPSPSIQSAVQSTIISTAGINKELILKKAQANRTSHRTPELCDKILVEVQGYEILE